MNASELIRLTGAAIKVADQAEELIEFMLSLGPSTLSYITETEEFTDFEDTVQEYIQIRETTDVEIR